MTRASSALRAAWLPAAAAVWLLLAVSAFGQAPAPAPGSSCSGLVLNGFGKSLSQLAAEDQGYFQKILGYPVCYKAVAGSVAQIADLNSGAVYIGTTAADNIVPQYLAGRGLQLVATNGDASGLTLLGNTRLGVFNVSDIKGKALAVDSPTSGYVIAARLILDAYGLSYPRDYSYVVLGGGGARFEALRNGSAGNQPVAASMNSQPYVERAELELTYIKPLARFTDFLDPYASSAVVVNRTWAQANPGVVSGVLTALLLGNEYAFNPANQDKMTRIIMQENNVSMAVANATYYAYRRSENPNWPGPPDFTIDPDALENTIVLRQEFIGYSNQTISVPDLVTPGPAGLFDNTYIQQANATLASARQRVVGPPVSTASTGGM